MSSRKKPAAAASKEKPPMRSDMRPPMRPDIGPLRTAVYEAAHEMTGTVELLKQNGRRGRDEHGLIIRIEGDTVCVEVRQTNEHDPIILKIEYVLDFLLSPSRASDAMLDLEEVYDRRWLPKYGLRAARLIFASQAAGLIWSFHSQRITKWLGGALGLMKLYGWLSGPRGG